MRRIFFEKTAFKFGWLASGILLVFLGLLASQPEPALACTTTIPPPGVTPTTPTINEKITGATIIFEGVVISQEMQPFEAVVSRYFKGKQIVDSLQNNRDSTVQLQSPCLFASVFGIHAIIYGYLLDNQLNLYSYTTLSLDESQNNELIGEVIKEVGQAPQPPSNTSLENSKPNTLQTLIFQALIETESSFDRPGWPWWMIFIVVLGICILIGFVAWKGAFSPGKEEKRENKSPPKRRAL